MIKKIAVSLFVFCAMSWAQTDRANVTGTVQDQSGAVVPAAKVTAVHVATNVSRSTVASSQGEYTISQLPVGVYRVEFEAQGFKTLTRSNITLTAGSTIRVDAAMQIGQVSESISVSAEAAILQTDSARVTTAVTPKFVEDLPLVVGGQLRSPLDMVLVAPETKNTYNLSVGGGQEGGWDMTVDGISATPAAPFEQRLWTMINSPSIDAVQEFAVDTNGFKAEFGHAGGGMFSFVSKSGTNEFHGNAYEFLRNYDMDANYFFNNANGRPKTILKQNDFGGTFGGPLWIPKIYNGKDKTFFFASYEGFRNRTAAPVKYYTVPLPEMYQGDFSNWKTQEGALMPIYDPTTTRKDESGKFVRTPFAGNLIPQGRISTVAKNVLPFGQVMTPNAPDPAGILNPNPRQNYITTTGGSTYPWDKYSGKLDHIFSTNHRLGFMIQNNDTLQLTVGVPPGLPTPINNDFQYGDTWTTVYRATWDWTLSPTTLNHFSAGVNNEGQVRRATNEQFQQGWGTKVGLKNTPVPDLLMPQFSFDGYSTWARAEFGGSYNKLFAVADDITMTRGSHTFKFGFTFQEDHYNGYGMHSASGSVNFSRLGTSVPLDSTNTSGNGFASFLLGWVNNGSIETPRVVSNQWRYYATYIQDDWKVNRKLTLSLGLRWEMTPPSVEGHFPDGYSNFNPNLPNPGAGGRLGAMEFAGFGEGRIGSRTMFNAWPYGFGPRLGVAYSVNDKTVFRLSAARSFAGIKNTGGSSHFQGFIHSQGWDFQDSSITPAFLLDQGFPFWPQPPFLKPDVQNGKDASYWQSYDAGRLPEYYNLNFNIQRQLRSNQVIEVGYSGTMGHHLTTNMVALNRVQPDIWYGYLNKLGGDVEKTRALMTTPIAQADPTLGIPMPYPGFTGVVGQALKPYPQFNNIVTGGDGGDRSGNSTYHALVVKWEKRYSSGLTFLNSYVFSKFFTDAEAANAQSSGAMDQFNRQIDKTLSWNDRTHNFKFSYSYELPFGRGKRFLASGIGNHLLGGWRIAGIHTYVSGAPMSLSPGYSPIYSENNRVSVTDYNGWQAQWQGDKFDPFKDLSWFDKSVINKTPQGSTPAGSKVWVLQNGFGNSTVRNPKLRNPWALTENVSLARSFRITERFRLDIRGEGFNLFNRVQWAAPDTGITSNNFGRVTGQDNLPRQMQLGMKLFF